MRVATMAYTLCYDFVNVGRKREATGLRSSDGRRPRNRTEYRSVKFKRGRRFGDEADVHGNRGDNTRDRSRGLAGAGRDPVHAATQRQSGATGRTRNGRVSP